MGLLFAGLIAMLVPLAGFAQQGQEPFQEAGVCARCHVISVVEWGMSGHRNAATRCTSCHGRWIGPNLPALCGRQTCPVDPFTD